MNKSFLRGLIAGPLALIAAFLAMAATPLVAHTESGINHIVLPIVLFPAYLAVTCLYAVIDDRLLRASGVLLAVCAVSGVFIFRAMT